MSRLTIYKEKTSDSVKVSNRFIDEYMASANDAQIKVYLYLLRMVSASHPTSISDIADKFNHTERDVMRALSYWEKLGLIEIEYDAKGEICGLQLPTAEDLAVHAEEHRMQQGEVGPVQKTTEGAQILSLPVGEGDAAKESAMKVKKDFSREQLKTLQQQEDFSLLLVATETYFGRPLTKTDLQSLAFIHEDLGFSSELMEYLVEYCVGRNHRDMRYIEKVAVAWSQSGIKTVRQAKLRSSRYEKIVYSVMQALGRGHSEVTQVEADYILRWYHEYGFSEEVILYACEKCVLATDKNRIQYTEGILKKWHQQGCKTLSQIQKAESRRTVPVTANTQSVVSKLPQNQYAKRDNIDYDSLEKEFLKYQ